MKKRILNHRSKITRSLILMFLTAISFAANADHLEDHLLLSAKLDGNQSVPIVTTDAVGVAGLTLNNTRDQLCVILTVNGLSGPITAAHIHEGAVGVAGDVLINLGSGIEGNQISITLSGDDLSSENLAKLLMGNTYINIHTAENPMGEIRGQVILESDHSFVVKTNGNEEVPAVMTDALGLGVFTLTKDMSQIKYRFIANDLSGEITGAHLHLGMLGENGDVEQNLTDDINGNVIEGTFTPTATLLSDLMTEEIYLNIHTAMNPNGEIRGQLIRKNIAFDAWIDGSQSVPMNESTALGVASFSMNAELNELTYEVRTDGLSGVITAAHIHEGSVGENGDVLVDLTSGIDGMSITGIISSENIDDATINKLLRGETYINIHTDLNPMGEIRGQIYRLAREGYTSVLGGDQEVPAIEVPAVGSGIVSVSRDQDNAHYMFVISGLSGENMGVHFHNAEAGANGDVVYNLTPYFNGGGSDDSAFGYWTSMDMDMPFGMEESIMFRNNEMYINVHTAENPMGEIRGQINRGVNCYNIVSVTDPTYSRTEFTMYPNPADDRIFIQINDDLRDRTLNIIDLNGRVISTENLSNISSNLTMNVADLESGIYFIQITQNDGLATSLRFMKK